MLTGRAWKGTAIVFYKFFAHYLFLEEFASKMTNNFLKTMVLFAFDFPQVLYFIKSTLVCHQQKTE